MTPDPYLRNLFVETLRLTYSAHQQSAEHAKASLGTVSLPKLRQILKAQATTNLQHAARLEPVFKALRVSPESRSNKAVEGLADAERSLVATCDSRQTRDLAHLGSDRATTHVFLASYATLRLYALALGYRQAVKLFDRTAKDLRLMDQDLTRIASRIAAHAGDRGFPKETVLHTTAALRPVRTAATALAVAAVATVALVASTTPAETAPRGWKRLLPR